MSVQNYGIVGVKNVTVTMYQTRVEDAQMAQGQNGETLEDNVISKRCLAYARKRLRDDINRVNDEKDAQLPGIFPVN